MKTSVGLLFGGESPEHEISVATALIAAQAVDRQKYELVPVYFARGGRLFTGDRLLDAQSYADVEGALRTCRRVVLAVGGEPGVLYELKDGRPGAPVAAIGVALPAFHGPEGEDGKVQGLLELARIPYTGCGVLASALGAHKVAFRRVMQTLGIPTLELESCNEVEWVQDFGAVLARIGARIPLPAVVKPVDQGSSVGISVARDRDELEAAITAAFAYSDSVLVERCLQRFQEVNCAVRGDARGVETSVIEAEVPANAYLSYDDKIHDRRRRTCPAALPAAIEAQIKQHARAAFLAVGGEGLARVDFLYEDDGGRLYLSEINTLPGGLSFDLWAASGRPFSLIIDELIDLALERHERQRRLRRSVAAPLRVQDVCRDTAGLMARLLADG